MDRITIQDFIGNTAISATVKPAARNPHMDDMGPGSRHFLVTLRAGRFSMRVPFSQGSAHTVDPTAADVLDCLASDACGYENSAGTFNIWCAEYGYDTDSRKAHRIYATVQRQAKRLRAMLGDANYERLLYSVERA